MEELLYVISAGVMCTMLLFVQLKACISELQKKTRI